MFLLHKILPIATVLIGISFIKPLPKIPESTRSKSAIALYQNKLKIAFSASNLTWGNPVFIRIYKQESVLEVWVKKNHSYVLFKSYPICYYSGNIGPKTKMGDAQAPEGIYQIKAKQLNPNSNYHLSLNIGYPNAFDLFHGYTGNFIMIHGNCVSIGCFAMTDPIIEEIWTLLASSLTKGQQNIPVHIFPFSNMSAELSKHKGNKHYQFWKQLAPIDSVFNTTAIIPDVRIIAGKYIMYP